MYICSKSHQASTKRIRGMHYRNRVARQRSATISWFIFGGIITLAGCQKGTTLPVQPSNPYGFSWRLDWAPRSQKIITTEMKRRWPEQLTLFWYKHLPDNSLPEIISSMSNIAIHFHDDRWITINGVKYAGLSIPHGKGGTANLSTLNPDTGKYDLKKVESLFRHEVSHFIVGKLNNMWDQSSSHALFKKVGVDIVGQPISCTVVH